MFRIRGYPTTAIIKQGKVYKAPGLRPLNVIS